MGTTYNKPAVTPAWGETNTAPADMVQPSNTAIQTGWTLSSDAPVRQYWNWILNFCANAIRYFMQRGLVDYDATETYNTGARIIGDDNNTYASLVDANIGNTPSTSPSKWAPWALSLAQINASQLTQATPASGDSTTKVANTSFVTNAIASAVAALTALISGKKVVATVTDSTGTRNFGTVYQNTSSNAREVCVDSNGSLSSPGTVTLAFGPTSGLGMQLAASCPTTGQMSLTKIIPAGWYWEATSDTGTKHAIYETDLTIA